MRNWGTDGRTANDVFLYRDSHRGRMGHCKWLPEHGDYCVCEEHAGDFFHQYRAFRMQPDGTLKEVGVFGAYVFGEPVQGAEVRRTLELRITQLGTSDSRWRKSAAEKS